MAGAGVYISAASKVSSSTCADDTASRVNGVALDSVSDGEQVRVMMNGTIADLFLTAAPGTRYFLGPAGKPVLVDALPNAARVIQLGLAKNSTDLFVQVFDYGRRASL